MNAYHHKFGIAFLILFTLLTCTGCQPESKKQAGGAPMEIVVAEKEANCPFMDFEEQPAIAIINDPELGDVDRAFIVKWNFTCPEPYLRGTAIAIQDGYYLEDGTYYWTGFAEIITDEGGVWKGTCVNTAEKSSVCQLKGEGKYKGLMNSTEYIFNTSTIKFRITRQAEE